MSGSPDATGGHLVPAPPPRAALPKRKRSSRNSRRLWLWPLAFAAGVGLGIATYQFSPDLDFYFDYWVALLFS